MKPCLVILHGNDLVAAPQIAAQHDGLQVVVFDPALVDKATAAQLGPVHCLGWPEGPGYRALDEAAHRAAHRLEAALDQVMAAQGPGRTLRGWQHLSLFYLSFALQWYGPMFDALADELARLADGAPIQVPVCDNPQMLYFPSFVTPMLLLQQLMRRGIAVQAFTYGRQDEAHVLAPDLSGPVLESLPPPGADWVLVHLPTCLYDAPYFSAELRAAGRTAVKLEARYWDMPIDAVATVPLKPADQAAALIDAAALDRIETVVPALQRAIDDWLAEWLSAPLYRTRQAELIARTYRTQLIAEAVLERQLAGREPSRLVLSDHDTGLHGPLLAWAKRRHVSALILPHSKTSTDLDFPAPHATVLVHAIQGEPVYDLDGARPPQFSLEFPGRLQLTLGSAGTARRVGLVLNGVSLNGVPAVDFGRYYAGIRRIAQWCTEHGAELVLRSRPGVTLFAHLSTQAGLSAAQLAGSTQGTMADFAENVDLCLMYDAPTSGALEMLNRGVPVLNPVVTALTRRETATMAPAIVPRVDLECALRQAALLLRDPVELQRVRKQQFLAHARHCAEALPLRAFL